MTNTKALDLAVRRETDDITRRVLASDVTRLGYWPPFIAHYLVSIRTEYRRIIEADAVCDAHKYLASKASSVGVTPPDKL